MKEHLRDFENPDNRTSSNLSGHYWDLKDQSLSYSLKWSIIDRAPLTIQSQKMYVVLEGETSHNV